MQTEFRHCQFNGRLLLMVILEILPLVPVISIKVKVKTQPVRRTHSDWILRAQSEAKCILCSSYEETQMIRGEIEVCMPWSLSHIKSLSSGKGQAVLMSVKTQGFVKSKHKQCSHKFSERAQGSKGSSMTLYSHCMRTKASCVFILVSSGFCYAHSSLFVRHRRSPRGMSHQPLSVLLAINQKHVSLIFL